MKITRFSSSVIVLAIKPDETVAHEDERRTYFHAKLRVEAMEKAISRTEL